MQMLIDFFPAAFGGQFCGKVNSNSNANGNGKAKKVDSKAQAKSLGLPSFVLKVSKFSSAMNRR